MLVDAHAHLSSPQFAEDREAVIQRAGEAGVGQIIDVGTDLDSSREALDLARRNEGVYATAGFHPHDAERADEDAMRAVGKLLVAPETVAVGETGLDFYRDWSPRDRQEEVFRRHIRLAREHGLPLVIHSRGAEDRVLDLLEEEGADEVGGVLHCFGGDEAQARRGIDLNFHLGFGGTVTFPRSTSLAVALAVPEGRVVLETDCPYLSPVPHRGRRNEPAHVRTVAKFLAEQHGEPAERVAERTTANAVDVFRLAGA
jgi:TatD DNase family protein